MQTSDEIPVGVWLRLQMPQFPDFVGFTYVDSEAGVSAKGGPPRQGDFADKPALTVRLPMPGTKWDRISDAEASALKLPATPIWLTHYGPQPKSGSIWGRWRKDPRLNGRFHPEYPDDVQVLVHDGGPRITKRRPEGVWVRINDMDGKVFRGSVLNKPQQLESVAQYGLIQFIAPAGGKHLLMVTEKYLAERPNWTIRGCDKCGLTELFDAPSDLIRVVFPNMPAGNHPMMFTSFCGCCGGVQIVQDKEFKEDDAAPDEVKKWWQFWKGK